MRGVLANGGLAQPTKSCWCIIAVTPSQEKKCRPHTRLLQSRLPFQQKGGRATNSAQTRLDNNFQELVVFLLVFFCTNYNLLFTIKSAVGNEATPDV
jgi:hypothetical protein